MKMKGDRDGLSFRFFLEEIFLSEKKSSKDSGMKVNEDSLEYVRKKQR